MYPTAKTEGWLKWVKRILLLIRLRLSDDALKSDDNFVFSEKVHGTRLPVSETSGT
jgi:hypothetical protein